MSRSGEHSMDSFPEGLIRFLDEFNRKRDYYECHEVMEELWLEEGRDPLLQGLLQVAVGLHHFRNENVNGAIKLFSSALRKMEAYPDEALGLDLGRLKRDVAAYLEKLQDYPDRPFPFYDLDIAVLDPQLKQAVDRREGREDD